MEKKTFAQKVIAVQRDLKAPKSQFNSFGGFRYRTAEDILMAVKPLLAEQGLILTMSDEVVVKSDENLREIVKEKETGPLGRVYIKATATITDGEPGHSLSASALARETYEKTKMDAAQITGSASSYARKYALNGLFLIDDTKDPDVSITIDQFISQIKAVKNRKELAELYNAHTEFHGDTKVTEVMTEIGKKYPKNK